MLIAVNMASNLLNGIFGSVGSMAGVVQPTAYFGISTAILAASAFWAMATWRRQANAYLGGVWTALVFALTVCLVLIRPSSLLKPSYVDQFAIQINATATAFGLLGLGALTVWTWTLTRPHAEDGQ